MKPSEFSKEFEESLPLFERALLVFLRDEETKKT